MTKVEAFGSVGDLLAALIAIPSVNPEGDPGTGAENCGEGRLAEFVGDLLLGLGAEVRFDEIEPDRPNVVASFPGGEGKPAVLLGPHLDTVGANIDLSWVIAESPAQTPELPHPDDLAGEHITALTLVTWRAGVKHVQHLATCHPHGYWLHWR